jgi:hypothetical protein
MVGWLLIQQPADLCPLANFYWGVCGFSAHPGLEPVKRLSNQRGKKGPSKDYFYHDTLFKAFILSTSSSHLSPPEAYVCNHIPQSSPAVLTRAFYAFPILYSHFLGALYFSFFSFP